MARKKSVGPRPKKRGKGGRAYLTKVQVFKGDQGIPSASSFKLLRRGLYINSSETVTAPPETTTNWYVSGSEGLVIVHLERIPNSGGHNHGGGPVGVASPSRFTLSGPYPQNRRVTVRTPTAAGTIRMRTTFSNGSIDEDYIEVVVPDLVSLNSSRKIVLVGSTSAHPANHYGTQTMVKGLEQLADKFFEKFRLPLYINDMSLASGGLFDISGAWKSPHKTHRRGREADIRSVTMSADQKTFFGEAARSMGFRAVLENPDSANEHWHVSI
jgi:hypothetical protein